MKVLLVNAKPCLIDALAAIEGTEVAAVWPRKHHFSHLTPPTRVPVQFYHGGRKFSARAAWQLRRIIRAQCPDVVHAFYGRALAHAAIALFGMRTSPKLISFRGITSPLSRRDAGDWLSYLHPRVDGHACESEAVRQAMIASGVAPDRCWVTFNTVYSEIRSRPGRSALAKFNIPADAFVVGTVGTFRRVKGADLLLKAAIECADLTDTYWLLIGRVLDPEVERLAADPRIRDRVRLVGHQPDAAELISGADLFVMPSRSEALCQALLEAMQQGVGPIVSDAGGMKEVVRDGIDGMVLPTDNSTTLANSIRTLHSDRARLMRFADSASKRLAETFTPQKVAIRLFESYGKVNPSRGKLAA
jgi:glycosyltransferase involved in cell wall biosynthesis